MTFEEIIELYELSKTVIKQNDNGDWDFDISPIGIKFDLTGADFNPDKRTKELELSTIKTLQDIFDEPGWELKNATNGINYGGMLLVEHHQHKKIEDVIEPSGILISKSGHWFFGIDDIGFIVLKKEFLLWAYEFNLKTKMMKDQPIESQSVWNTGHAFLIPYDLLPLLFKEYKKYLLL
jgi:hypothetical protein